MRLIAKVIRISHANFYCNRQVYKIFKIIRVSFFGTLTFFVSGGDRNITALGHFSPTIFFPRHFQTFSKIPDISLTAIKIPDISRFFIQVFIPYKRFRCLRIKNTADVMYSQLQQSDVICDQLLSIVVFDQEYLCDAECDLLATTKFNVHCTTVLCNHGE